MKSLLKNRNPWPIAIVVYFVVFASAIAGWVTLAVRNDMQLVRKDYYEEELKFQQQIDRMKRAHEVREGIAIEYNPSVQTIKIALPPAKDLTGKIHLYRPSDARLDREIPLAPAGDGSQSIDAHNLQPGLWKVKVYWSANQTDFYTDKRLVVGSPF